MSVVFLSNFVENLMLILCSNHTLPRQRRHFTNKTLGSFTKQTE